MEMIIARECARPRASPHRLLDRSQGDNFSKQFQVKIFSILITRERRSSSAG